jgi:hypothetical protein
MAATIVPPEPAPKCFCGKPRQVLSKSGSKRTYFLTCNRHDYNDWAENEKHKKELTKSM